MEKNEFYILLDGIFELNPGTINGSESLHDFGLVDSLSMLGLMSLFDNNFGIEIDPKMIMQMKFVSDLYRLMPSKN